MDLREAIKSFAKWLNWHRTKRRYEDKVENVVVFSNPKITKIQNMMEILSHVLLCWLIKVVYHKPSMENWTESICYWKVNNILNFYLIFKFYKRSNRIILLPTSKKLLYKTTQVPKRLSYRQKWKSLETSVANWKG